MNKFEFNKKTVALLESLLTLNNLFLHEKLKKGKIINDEKRGARRECKKVVNPALT